MSKKREGLFGFSKKTKEYDEILGDLELFKEKSKKELSRIINKLKIILQENKKLNTETSSLKDTIFQLENENLALKGDFKAVIDDNIIKERLEQKVLDFRVLVASLEKENAILQRNLYGKTKFKHNIRDINELEQGNNKRMNKGVKPSTQIGEISLDSATPVGVNDINFSDQAKNTQGFGARQYIAEEVLPPGDINVAPEPPGNLNVVEEVLPPGDINVAPEPPGSLNVVEEVLPPGDITEVPELPSSQRIVEEVQNHEHIPEKIDTLLPTEAENETFYIERNELTGKHEEKKKEETSELYTQRKRKCPKCGMTKRAFIKEIDDKTHIIMHSPRIYGKKYLCTSCFAEWK